MSLNEAQDQVESQAGDKYKYGFVTDIETDTAPYSARREVVISCLNILPLDHLVPLIDVKGHRVGVTGGFGQSKFE